MTWTGTDWYYLFCIIYAIFLIIVVLCAYFVFCSFIVHSTYNLIWKLEAIWDDMDRRMERK